MLWFLLLALVPVAADSRKNCGGNFGGRKGVLQTPNFPKKFTTPIDCEWIIKSERENTSIIVYLTQIYVFEGLTFTEYVEYDRYNKRWPGNVILSGEEVVEGKYVQCHKNVLVISLKLNSIENNHIRVMDNFMEVYGFNITYEITSREVRKDHCNMMDCGFTGICYDYITKFGCECFRGYSGPSCSEGPKSGCLNPGGSPLCQNGGFCRHIGDSFIKCECPEGFTGKYCSSATKSEDEETRLISCMSYDPQKRACECRLEENISTNDLYAYTGVVQLKSVPTSKDTDLKTYLSNEIMTNLQPNTTTIKDLHIINLESSQTEFGVTFRFYGSKSVESHLRSVINKWGEIGFIGNMTVVNPDIALYKEPIILSIQSVGVVPGRIIHEGDDFVLSCSAHGSPNMSFRWYKDGMFVNITQFKNNKWVTLRKGSSLTNYLAILKVDKATVLDGGLFTCQVEDFNVQQCLSQRVEIRSRPPVSLDAISLTVSKGASFSIKCSSYNSEGTSIYSWTKNGHLLPTKTKRERYDALYLTGSLLRVSGLSKSANYSCLVQDRTTKSEMSTAVIVVDKKRIKTCPEHFESDVTWRETAPGYESTHDCPPGYTGFAKRMCIMLDGNNPEWDTADMSDCVSTNMGSIIRDFEYLQLGYEAATPLQILNSTSNHLSAGVDLLQGEGVVIIRLISHITSYISKSNYTVDTKGICDTALSVVDKILVQNQSLISESQVGELQRTVKDLLFLCKRFLPLIETFTHDGNSVLVNIQPINKLTSLKSDLLTRGTKIAFELTFIEEDKQYLNSLINVVYFNLKNFMPTRSVLRINDSELDYIIASDIVATWYINEEKEIEFSNTLIFNIQFNVQNSIFLQERNFTCVQADFAPYGYYWNKSSCETSTINASTINCRCYKFGTIAVIATMDTSLEFGNSIKSPHRIIVLMGCSICLLLAIFSALLLIFHWIFHQNYITYLKSQSCCSIIGAMAVFILVHTNSIKSDAYLYINTLLQVFFLTSVSTQLNILLIVYSDVLRFKNDKNIKPTSICIITGAPIIIVLGNYISHISLNLKLYSWWIVIGSASFYIFVICCLILTILYIIMYWIINRCIKLKNNVKISKDRVILLKKSLYIFYAIKLVIISSILYVNIIDNILCHFVFSIVSMSLGIVLLLCYAIKLDHIIEQYFLRKISLKTNGDSKKGSITLNHNSNDSEETRQDISDGAEATIQTKEQSGGSKYATATINRKKHLRSNIRTPDILNRETCVSLDLLSSNVKQCRHKESTPSVCSLDRKRNSAKQGSLEMIETPANTIIKNENISLPNLKPTITTELQRCCEIRQCSKCVRTCECEGDSRTDDPSSISPTPVSMEVKESPIKRSGNLDAVMCSITNDLDYLLNRTIDTKSD